MLEFKSLGGLTGKMHFILKNKTEV
jgi:hypothetical protein